MKSILRKTAVAAVITGIFALTLPGCTQMREEGTSLSFHSFDGGDPEYSVSIENPDILSYRCRNQYAKANHGEINGAGYDVIFTFTGLKEGKTAVTVTCSSRIAENEETVYYATVDKDLSVTLDKAG